MNKTQIKILAAVIIGVLVYFFLPAAMGLTPLGVKLLSVFIPTVIIWLIVGGSGWSSLLSVTMIVMLGVYDGGLAYQMQWGTSLVAMVIPFFMLASVLEESGAIEYIVKWIISRKIVHGRPTLFSILFTISLLVVNVFVHPFVVLVLYFKLLRQIAADIGESTDSTFYRSHGMLIGWISQFCDGTLIWLRPWILSMVAIVAAYGFENFTITAFLRISIIYLLTATFILFLIVKLWIRPDVSRLKDFDDEAMRRSLKEKPLSRNAKTALIGMAAVMLSYLLSSFSVLGSIATYLGALPVAAPITLAVTLLCIISVDGKPVINMSKAALNVPWETVLFLGGIMFYASIFGGEQYGITVMLQNLLTPLVSSIPTAAAMLIALVAASIFTNLASNSVSVIVVAASFIPALLNIPGADKAKILAFGACIILTCATAICTRSACGVMGLLYAKDGIEWSGTQKYSITICVIMVAFCAVVLIPLGKVLLAGCI